MGCSDSALDLFLFNYPLLLSGIGLGLLLMVLVGIPSVAAGSAGRRFYNRTSPIVTAAACLAALGTDFGRVMLVATLVAGVVGKTLGPIAMLNVQGAAYVVAGLSSCSPDAPRAAPPRAPPKFGRLVAASSATSCSSASSGEKPNGPGLPG